jgi:hypothetical protein
VADFRKYDHLERHGRCEVQDITVGKVYVFPKLDGTNASVWMGNDGKVKCGSRNRTLSIDNDNAGFCAWVNSDDPVAKTLRMAVGATPHLTLYGEWLVPHSLKTYRSESWRRFWIFDVYDNTLQTYQSFNSYKTFLATYGLDVIPPLSIIDNPSIEQLDAVVALNTFQIKDGEGVGEGVVLKNYDWRNKFGRQPWAKIVRNEFKEINAKEFGPNEKKGPDHVEAKIAERYVTKALVDKVRAKVFLSTVANVVTISTSGPTDEDRKELEQKNRGKIIPELLHRVFYDVVNEDMWDAVKRHKNPTIDFKKLQSFITYNVKQHAEDLF